MRFLVTGGAGFIGSHVCKRLCEAGHDVIVLDDLSTGNLANLDGLELQFTRGSVTDRELVERLSVNVEAVAHLAALGSVPRSIENPVKSFEVNALGTLNVLEGARKEGARVVYASSSSVYGSVETLPRTEDLPTRPVSPYGASKLSAESLVLGYDASYGMSNLALRFFNVYGPRQSPSGEYAAVVPRFINAALAGLPIEIHGDGSQTRDFTFVETVADIVTSALENPVSTRIPINLAYGTRTSVNEIATFIEGELDVTLSRTYLPSRKGDIPASECSPESVLEYFPHIAVTDFKQGLSQTIDWYQRNLTR